jgi:hypothetical protein
MIAMVCRNGDAEVLLYEDQNGLFTGVVVDNEQSKLIAAKNRFIAALRRA